MKDPLEAIGHGLAFNELLNIPKPNEIEGKMKSFISSIPKMKKEMHPIQYSVMFQAIFVNIHPFIDGNGRVARLLMNLALLQSGYNITIIPPVARIDYIRALKDQITIILNLLLTLYPKWFLNLKKNI